MRKILAMALVATVVSACSSGATSSPPPTSAVSPPATIATTGPTTTTAAPAVSDTQPEPETRAAETEPARPSLELTSTVLPDFTAGHSAQQAEDVLVLADGRVIVGGWYRADAGDLDVAAVWFVPTEGLADRVLLGPDNVESGVTSLVSRPDGTITADGWIVDGDGRLRPMSWPVSAEGDVGAAVDLFADTERAGYVVDTWPTDDGLVRLIAEFSEAGLALVVMTADGREIAVTPGPGEEVFYGTSVAMVADVVVVNGFVRRASGIFESTMWAGNGPELIEAAVPDLAGHDLGELAADGAGLVMAVAPATSGELALARSTDGLSWDVQELVVGRTLDPTAPFMGAARVMANGETVLVAGGPSFPNLGVASGGAVDFDLQREFPASDLWPIVVDGEPGSVINFEMTFSVFRSGVPGSTPAEAVGVGWTRLDDVGSGTLAAAVTNVHTLEEFTFGPQRRWVPLDADGQIAVDDDGRPVRGIGVPAEAGVFVPGQAEGEILAIGTGDETNQTDFSFVGDVEIWRGSVDETRWTSEGIVHAAPGAQLPAAAAAFGDGWLVVGLEQVTDSNAAAALNPLVLRSDGDTVTRESVDGMPSGRLIDLAVAGDVAVATGRGGESFGDDRRIVLTRSPDGVWSPAPVSLPDGVQSLSLAGADGQVAVVAEYLDGLIVASTADGVTFTTVAVPFPGAATVVDAVVADDRILVVGTAWAHGADDLAIWSVSPETSTIERWDLTGDAPSAATLQLDSVTIDGQTLLISGVHLGQATVWSADVGQR